jgi:hypothetical protein
MMNEIVGDHQCGFWHKMPTTNQTSAFKKYQRNKKEAIYRL